MTGARGDDPGYPETAALSVFVELVPALVTDADGTEMLHLLVDRCAERFGPAHVGVVVGTSDGELSALVRSDTGAPAHEQLQLDVREGPCLDAVRDGATAVVDDLATARDRWPRWTELALASGLRSAYCYPMRVAGTAVGSLNLFGDRTGLLDRTAVRDCAGLADIATAVLLVQRRPRGLVDLGRELQAALDCRVAVEHARGLVAGALGVPVPEAATVLRTWCRATGRRLADVAADLNSGRLVPGRLGDPPPPPG